jgi:hypothetical protein
MPHGTEASRQQRRRSSSATRAVPEPSDGDETPFSSPAAEHSTMGREEEGGDGDDDDDDEVMLAEQSHPIQQLQLQQQHVFEGRSYPTYQDMVDAKRRRNERVLADSGLLDAADKVRSAATAAAHRRVTPPGSTRPNKKKKRTAADDAALHQQKRKSNRLAGIEADGRYVEDERAGRFSIAAAAVTASSRAGTDAGRASSAAVPNDEHYRGRLNDGSALSIGEAVQTPGGSRKWLSDDDNEEEAVAAAAAADAERFVREDVSEAARDCAVLVASPSRKNGSNSSSPSSSALLERVQKLRVDDDACVAKVTPDRIYGIAVHPTPRSLLVCAGDKSGHVGIWKVPPVEDGRNEIDAETVRAPPGNRHLFRLHAGAASCLQWTPSGSKLYSASYDGTVRCLDLQSESFEQVFATYDGSDEYRSYAGYNLDNAGHRYWTQYACLDPRTAAEQCLFVSTSDGTAMHVDLRAANGRGRVTFHEELSEKKINTLRYARMGYREIGRARRCV